jgi:hypothetical protein
MGIEGELERLLAWLLDRLNLDEEEAHVSEKIHLSFFLHRARLQFIAYNDAINTCP